MSMVDHVRSLLRYEALRDVATDLQDAISFFREYADGYHHGKEEDVLFKHLMQTNPGFESILDSLTDHHLLFRELLTRAEQAVAAGDDLVARQTLNEYLSAMMDHIAAENDELFVAADESLPEDLKQTIGFLFVDRDSERGMERKHELETYVAERTA